MPDNIGSPRQRRVMELLEQGLTPRQVAETMAMTVNAVYSARGSYRQRLGLTRHRSTSGPDVDAHQLTDAARTARQAELRQRYERVRRLARCYDLRRLLATCPAGSPSYLAVAQLLHEEGCE